MLFVWTGVSDLLMLDKKGNSFSKDGDRIHLREHKSNQHNYRTLPIQSQGQDFSQQMSMESF